jgi:ERCC4-type nuclease
MGRLAAGDYLIDDEVLVGRKTVGDFVASLIDGRLFPQAARLAYKIALSTAGRHERDHI